MYQIHSKEKNLSRIRNAGILAAQGEIILTIDADSLMSENLLLKVMQCLENDKHIGGGVLILAERWSVGIFLSLLALIPFLFVLGISAGAFFARRKDILALGGFDEHMYSTEDLEFARRLKAYGKKFNKKYKNFYSAYIITSCRKFDRFGDWYVFKNPSLMLKLLKGRKSPEADQIWYDF